jgi:predicted NUDIX family phosphoesterase
MRILGGLAFLNVFSQVSEAGASSRGKKSKTLADTGEATYLWVAETILRKVGRPLRAAELVARGLDDQLFDDQEISKTPQKSMQSRLSMEILRNGAESKFVRVAKGRFFLRDLLHKDGANDDGLEVYTAPRREAPPSSEKVLAIHRDNYCSILDFQGIGLGPFESPEKLLDRRLVTYLPRTEAETRDDLKQFVTYTIVQHETKILSFVRGQYNRAASFLRGARCVGFGGHVTDTDLSLFTYADLGIRANAVREISEEINLHSGRPQIDPEKLEILGVLNDNSSAVGVRHLAIVMRYWVEDFSKWAKPQRGEASINRLRWIDTREEALNLSDFEYWSQLCIRKYYPQALHAAPSYRIQRQNIFKGRHIACVVGAIGSGKSATTNALKSRAGYAQINSGQVLAGLLGIPAVPESSRADFQQAAYGFISKPDGPKALAAALIDAAKRVAGERIVIDGIRHPETLAELKDMSDVPLAVLYVYTPPDVAFEMYKLREDHGLGDIDFDAFVDLYNAPVEGQVRYMIQDADVVLYNWIGLSEYEKTINDMLIKLGLMQ